MQLDSAGKLTEGGTCNMLPNVCFICNQYKVQVYKQTGCLVQHLSTVTTETEDKQIKIVINKSDDKEKYVSLLRMLTLTRLGFLHKRTNLVLV